MRQSQRLIHLMVFITVSISLATTGNLFIQNEVFSNFLNDFQYVGIFISLVTFFVQQLSDQRAKKTEFFIELKNSFIMDETLMDVYDALYKYSIDKTHMLQNIKQKDIVKYLAYFDSVALACENKIIDIDEIDKTFAYYFFLATNNPFVQENELVADGEYYPRIYQLYDKLYQYKRKHNKEILLDDTGLHTTCKYDKIVKEVK